MGQRGIVKPPVAGQDWEPSAFAPVDLSRWLTVAGAAVRMGVKPKVVYDWIARGHLPAIRHGRRVVVDLDDLLDAERDVRERDRTGTAARRVAGAACASGELMRN